MIYFRGCLSREKLKVIPDATVKLLKMAGIDYTILDNEGCCGSILLRTGFVVDAIEIMKDTLKDLKGEKVLVSCAGCYRAFMKDYPDILGEELDVIHTSQLFDQLIKEGKIEPSVTQEEVTYHDPCHLGRHLGEYETPRQVIQHFSRLVEMEDNREKARCCGAGGGVRSAFSDLSLQIARMRMDDAKKTRANSLVTCCPFCVLNLTDGLNHGIPTGSMDEDMDDIMDIMDLSQFLLKQLSKRGNHE